MSTSAAVPTALAGVGGGASTVAGLAGGGGSYSTGMPAGNAPDASMGGGIGVSQNVMPEAMGPGGGPATQDVVMPPGDSSFGGLAAAMRGMQNMLGNTPEERSANAKALAKGVDSINGLVQDVGETTLMKRMMEAQSKGLGFMDPEAASGGIRAPEPTAGGSMAPIMSQLGFR